ncbi:MAG: sensor histidine kinase [Polyangiales bacterium]
MSDEKRRWSGWGSIAMAVLAAIALGVTVFVAQRALSHASDIVVRGEADALLSALVADIAQEGAPPTPALLERELGTYAAKGLRYVAVFDRDHTVVEAGSARMPEAKLRPGESSVLERRVRVAGILPPVRVPRELGPRPPHMGPALLVIELEPPVIEQLRGNLTRLSVVAVGAAGALLAFAFALSRNARRLAAIEQRAQREQRLVALGSMSSVMAHELRNPLASLKGHAQLLAEDLEDDKQRKKAERVVAEAERLEVLTTSLLDCVRDGPIERTSTTAESLVERALEHLPYERVEVKTRDVTMIVDESRLARAVHNLVDNALKASPEEAKVELSIEQRGNDAVITVRDHGPGIPADSAIFEPFVTTRVRGTGLGLPVARRIAEQHGGTLSAENDPSGGAVFTLRFPNSSSS